MCLPPELLTQIIRLYANSTFKPRLRRQRLFHLFIVSPTFRDLAEQELLREAFVDGANSLRWLEERVQGEKASAVEAVSFLLRAGEGMLERDAAVELLVRPPRLRSLTMEYQPTRFQWERLAVAVEKLEKVEWSSLTSLTLLNISLNFNAAVPLFPSLTHLTLTASRLSLPAPFPAGAHLPPASFPSLRYLSLRDAPGVDYRFRDLARGPVPLYRPRHLLPLTQQLHVLVLDYRIAQSLRHGRGQGDLFPSPEEGKVAVVWEFRDSPDDAAAMETIKSFSVTQSSVQYIRIASLSFLSAFDQLLGTAKELQTATVASLLPAQAAEGFSDGATREESMGVIEAVDEEGEAEREPEEFFKWCSRRREEQKGQ